MGLDSGAEVANESDPNVAGHGSLLYLDSMRLLNLNLYVCTFGKGVAGKDTMWYQKGEEKPLKPRRCPMPQPIICLDEEVCHFAEGFRSLFSKPQYQYFVTVLLGLMECDGRRTLSGLLHEVGQSSRLSGLSRIFSESP